MPSRLHRRAALQTAAALSAGVWLSSKPAESASPNEKLNVALIGIGGQGAANLRGVSSENIVALCDVDDQRAGKAYEEHPKAKKFYDYRRMFDEMEREIDAVVVSTPDHAHFHPSMMAMLRGKHLYCEKPMGHNVWEVRTMTETARKQKVATQLGVQRHTLDNMHRVVELIQSGAIGPVREVYSWMDGDRGMPAYPPKTEPAPEHVKWDLWLGPAAERPFSAAYCPYGWRFWWDFGTGETGNFGCHILDIPFWALGLTHPTRVSAQGPTPHPQTTPKAMDCRFEFPAEGDRPAVTLHWSHVKGAPAQVGQLGVKDTKGANTLFLGEKGMLLCGFTMRKLLPESAFAGLKAPAKTIPDSPGFHKEWIAACKGGEAATCNFDYSGPLTETVLLGNVAYRAGEAFAWQAADLRAAGSSKAQSLVREEYRSGWEI